LDNGPEAQQRFTPDSRQPKPFTSLQILIDEHNDYLAFVLLGAPGSGKSTLLQHLEFTIAKAQSQYHDKNPIVPFYIPLNRYEPAQPDNPAAWLSSQWASQSRLHDCPDFFSLASVQILRNTINAGPCPVGWPGTWRRVLRGGSWNNNQVNARCSYRNNNHPNNRNNNVGFRLSCESHISFYLLGWVLPIGVYRDHTVHIISIVYRLQFVNRDEEEPHTVGCIPCTTTMLKISTISNMQQTFIYNDALLLRNSAPYIRYSISYGFSPLKWANRMSLCSGNGPSNPFENQL